MESLHDMARMNSNASAIDIKNSWGNGFSNPSEHRNGQFLYLVHGILNETCNLIQTIALLEVELKNPGSFSSSQRINLLMEPEKIHEKQIISCSVIDQDHTDTFGSGGFILRSPYENILDVFYRDVGTNFFDPSRALRESQKSICTLDELLRRTSQCSYNEVVLTGTTDFGKVEIIALWSKVYDDGDFVDPIVAHRISQLKYRLNLPLIEIPEMMHEYKDSRLEVLSMLETKPPYGFAINRGGLRFVIEFDKDKFTVYDKKIRGRPMTKMEFTQTLKIVKEASDETQKQRFAAIFEKLEKQFFETPVLGRCSRLH